MIRIGAGLHHHLNGNPGGVVESLIFCFVVERLHDKHDADYFLPAHAALRFALKFFYVMSVGERRSSYLLPS